MGKEYRAAAFGEIHAIARCNSFDLDALLRRSVMGGTGKGTIELTMMRMQQLGIEYDDEESLYKKRG